MLCLTRKQNEQTVITTKGGEKIIVTVVELDRGKVRLGFEAPHDVKIHRKEVQDEIDHDGPRAA